jgi:acyl-homoserine-lactone acylase
MSRMPRFLLAAALVALIQAPLLAQAPTAQEIAAWQTRANGITITRDDWGIAHIRGRTDADAVFGMIYAQAEDDFNRVENNYLTSLGRQAEAQGETAIWQDLRQRLFINPDTLKKLYNAAPASMKALMDGWAAGLNFYLYKHPELKPRAITRFEPWMALSFSEGSIGGDIEKVNLMQLSAFYGRATPGIPAPPADVPLEDREPGGSNGIAIAPSRNANGRAMLWINPHTSFFFRSELQMTSDEGLNAYGAVTWGQFFIYQGFNEKAGWMHTTSSVDQLDEYLETVEKRGTGWIYKYGTGERPVTTESIAIRYSTPTGMQSRTFTVYRTHHGPVTRELNGKWVTMKLMNKPLEALQQSYGRTKTKNLGEFLGVMEANYANSSNNTLFADAEGNIAYIHANFIPKRDPKFNWRMPVDGSDPATEWGPLNTVRQNPLVTNPATGWVYNTNNSPWTAAGPNSQKQADFPAYVDNGAENPRAVHALKILPDARALTLQGLIDIGFSPWVPTFAEQIPPLVKAWDDAPATHPLKTQLSEPIALLRAYDFKWASNSVPTALAVFYAGPRMANATPEERLTQLQSAMGQIASISGNWKTPWGDINRFQRISNAIVHPFDDAAPSIPVPFVSANFGSLAAYGSRAQPGTKKWYGTSGNSFLAAVEFGRDSVRARAITAGGESGDVKSKHFNDQAERYANGNLREVYFYPNHLARHTERTYRPGG